MSRFRPRLTYANVMVTLLAFVVLAGGGALAATSFVSSKGQIHGCVSGKGKLVLVKSGGKCKKGLTTIAWNQRGPRGLTGGRGRPGTIGPPGPTFLTTRAGAPPATPAATPDETVVPAGRTFSFTLPGAGVVYIRYFTPLLGQTCTSGDANAGIYLDGSPVASSGHFVSPASSPESAEFTAKTAVAGGTHTVDLRMDCPGGDLATRTEDASDSAWTVLLVGG
jgi:hypothetical protein